MEQSTDSPPRRRWVWDVVRYGIAVALLAWMISAGVLEWRALAGLFTRWWVTLGALALVAVGVVATSWRFRTLLRPRRLDIELADSVRLAMIGMFFNTVLPGAGGGDAVRFYYGVRDHGGRRTEIVTVMLLDRVCGLFGMVLWPVVAAPFFAPMWVGNAILTGLLAGGLAATVGIAVIFLASWTRLSREDGPLRGPIQRLPLGGLVWTVVETIGSYRGHRGAVGRAILASLFAHTMLIGGALLVAATIDPEGFSWAMSMLIPMGMLANTVPLTPGGLGVGEAAFDTLFGLAGLSGGAEVLLGWRLLVLTFGLAGLGVYLSGHSRFITDRTESPEASVG